MYAVRTFIIHLCCQFIMSANVKCVLPHHDFQKDVHLKVHEVITVFCNDCLKQHLSTVIFETSRRAYQPRSRVTQLCSLVRDETVNWRRLHNGSHIQQLGRSQLRLVNVTLHFCVRPYGGYEVKKELNPMNLTVDQLRVLFKEYWLG